MNKYVVCTPRSGEAFHANVEAIRNAGGRYVGDLKVWIVDKSEWDAIDGDACWLSEIESNFDLCDRREAPDHYLHRLVGAAYKR